MTDATEMPLRIWAQTRGVSTEVFSGERGLIGGWDQRPREGHTPYVRADAEAGMRRIEAIAESERKAQAEVERLREALSDATVHLVGASSAYRQYASRHHSIGQADVDPFYTTRVDDFDKAAGRARAALGEGET